MQWMHIKWLRFEKDVVKFGYSVNADELCIIDVTGGAVPIAW